MPSRSRRWHAISPFFEPILATHDRAQFEVFCYSDLRIDPDATTARLEAAADHWRAVARMSDEEIDRVVRDDRIDILVDLTGHVGGNRLLVFARKPAPVQVSYLGYQNTTGMSAIDYRLTDAHADPPGPADRFYTEELIRLGDCFFCYRPLDDAPSVAPLPALKTGAVTFGSFNSFAKVTPQTIEAWLEILARVPRSRLLVLTYREGYVAKSLIRAAREHGVDATRVELADRRAPADYLRLVGQADIALDPLGFNGHTTSCDAVWMGVPVVMLEGNGYALRFGTSVLANVGLQDWIARSHEEYVALAVERASDLVHLVALRAQLRPRMAASPVLDFAGFTRKLEQAYRAMWVKRCAAT